MKGSTDPRPTKMTWMLFGSLCALTLGVPLLVFGRSLWFDHSVHNFVRLVNEGQAIITGVIAIQAAAVAGYFVNRQIVETRLIEQEKINRRFRAVKASLPIILGAIGDYAKECSLALEPVYHSSSQIIQRSHKSLNLPVFPVEIIKEISEIIEYGPDNIIAIFESLIRSIQIHLSRIASTERALAGRSQTLVLRQNILNHMVDIAEIDARKNVWFSFARGSNEIPSTTITASMVIESCWILLENPEQVDQLGEYIRNRYTDT